MKILHRRAKLLSLDHRHQIQLLTLMFINKKNENVARVYNVYTCGAGLYHFYLGRNNTWNSPYYIGSELWDMLRPASIECDRFFMLITVLKMKLTHTMFHNYCELYFVFRSICFDRT